VIAKVLFWGSLGALAWTQAGYPLAAAGLARVRGRPVRREEGEPEVTLIVAAHNEESVIERRLDNLLQLDYPRDRVEIVVASDASTDRTDELVEAIAARDARVRLLRCARDGKVAAQNRAVETSEREIVAFSDANAQWKPDALRKLVRNFADPDVAYVCGGHYYEATDGTNRESTYWRYEAWLRRSESALGSITGGIGPIYAVRRSDYVHLDGAAGYGHDLVFPYRLTQSGRRAVFEPEAVAWEKPSHDIEDEYRRRQRMLRQSWNVVLRGRMLRRQTPLYWLQLISHRHLRYSSGLLHLVLLGSTIALLRRGPVYQAAFAAQIAWLALAIAGRLRARAPGAAIAYYYAAMTWGTTAALAAYLRDGAPSVWDKAEGTR
jgi:cellulose synthase/poly-beta-1,6-N-acetylglucosamine synthase-like glycosyltransferase